MIETAFQYVMANSTAFALGALFVIAIGSTVGIVCMIIAMVRLHTALLELKRARMEIRGHAPMQVARKMRWEEKLKREYEKRGIPWETTGKS